MEGEKDAVEAVVKGYVLMVFDENDGLEANGFAQDSLKAETPLGRVRRYSGKTESFEKCLRSDGLIPYPLLIPQ